MNSPSKNTSSMGINFSCQGQEHSDPFGKKNARKQAHACDIYLFIEPSFPSPFFRLWPCVTTHLASVDSVIILVGISASAFGFMRDPFLCMVHALLTATPEYVKVNDEVMLLDTGQMSPRIHWRCCLAFMMYTHTTHRHCNPKPFSWLYLQQWHN